MPAVLIVSVSVVFQWYLLSSLAAIALAAKDSFEMVEVDNRYSPNDICLAEETGTEVHQGIIRKICLFIMLVPAAQQIYQSLSMTRWLLQIPSWHAEHQRILDADSQRIGNIKFRHRIIEITHLEGKEEKTGQIAVEEFATGITHTRRCIAWLTCVGPKLWMEIYMVIVGSGFVATSDSNANLILNCLAVSFVLDIDDMLYNLLVMPSVRLGFEALPPIGLCFANLNKKGYKKNEAWTIDLLYLFGGTWVTYMVVVTLASILENYWCGVEVDMAHVRGVFGLPHTG